MQLPSTKRPYRIVVILESGLTRTVTVKASSREVAERRALKRANGVSVQRPQ